MSKAYMKQLHPQMTTAYSDITFAMPLPAWYNPKCHKLICKL